MSLVELKKVIYGYDCFSLIHYAVVILPSNEIFFENMLLNVWIILHPCPLPFFPCLMMKIFEAIRAFQNGLTVFDLVSVLHIYLMFQIYDLMNLTALWLSWLLTLWNL